MKIKVQTYAELLYKLLERSDGKRVERLLYGFLLYLRENGDWGKAESIIRAFGEYYKKKEAVTTAMATMAQKMDDDLQKAVNNYIKKIKPLAKKIELTEVIDQTVLGGIRVVADDIMLDGTIKKQISNLKNALIQ